MLVLVVALVKMFDWILRKKKEPCVAVDETPASYVYVRGAMVGEIEVGNVDVVILDRCAHEAVPKLVNVGRLVMNHNIIGRPVVEDEHGLEWVT